MLLEDVMERAKILVEALPYIKEYHGKTVVMKYVGINPIIVHGGGPEITRTMKALGKEVNFVNGQRVTDKDAIEVVKMVLVGKVNKQIVSLINRHGKLAVGLSGDDGNLIVAKKKEMTGVDLGFVGDVTAINTKILDNLINDDFIPVVATVGAGEDGNSYNINADRVAGEIAAAVKADKVIFLTDVDGLYNDFEDKSSLISELTLDACEKKLAAGEIGTGMLPKVEGCVTAVKAGVSSATILNGTILHALLLEVFTAAGIGTMIKR
jgi:acetylglutamate kinase